MPIHNISIDRDVDISRLRWPDNTSINEDIDDEEDDNVTMGWVNRDFMRVGHVSWDEVRNLIVYEKELLNHINEEDSQLDYDAAVEDDEYEHLVIELGGFDVGIASCVLALSAAGCITMTSCNGSYGHDESYPLVVFRCRGSWIPILLTIAEKTGCGLENSYAGTVVVYANDVRSMLSFAEALLLEHELFDELGSV